MKIISREQAIQFVRMISEERNETIDASEFNYEYLDVYPNGDVVVGISLCGFNEIYEFTIHDKTITLQQGDEK